MKISIVLTAYNAATYLRAAMDSIIAQTHKDWEAICIDDGSTDETGDILDAYANGDARIKVFHHPNKGLAACRQEGVDLSSGEYITFCDADDMIAPQWLSNAVSLLEVRRPQLLRAHLLFAKEMPSGFFNERASHIENSVTGRRDCLLWSWRVFFTSGFAVLNFIRADLKPYIRFNEKLPLKEDTMMLVNLAPQLTDVVQSDYCGYFYRQTSGSLLRRKKKSRSSVLILKALSDIWGRQQGIAGELGVAKALRHAIQKFADNDVIDWAVDCAHEPASEKIQVHKAWRNLRGCGAFDGSYSHRKFLYLPFQWWKVTGKEFLIGLTWRLFLVGRKLLLRKDI